MLIAALDNVLLWIISTVGESWKIEGTLRDDGAEETFSFTYTGEPGFKN